MPPTQQNNQIPMQNPNQPYHYGSAQNTSAMPTQQMPTQQVPFTGNNMPVNSQFSPTPANSSTFDKLAIGGLINSIIFINSMASSCIWMPNVDYRACMLYFRNAISVKTHHGNYWYYPICYRTGIINN